MRIASRIAAAVVAALPLSCASPGVPEPNATAPALDGFGEATWRITTSSDEAQRLFARGLLQLYAFNQTEAARAFKAALARDPHCAMCAWGVAMALGPNINAVEREDLGEARRYAAIARRESTSAPRLERLLVEAVVARYGEADDAARGAPPEAPICSSAGGRAPHPLDVRYAELMQAAVEAYPDHPDVISLNAEARMIATRVDWWDPKTGEPAPGIADMTARLERALAAAPLHTGLNHYLIHAVDAPGIARRAESAADRLGTLAPESPHLLHMPAHTYVRLGRWNDAVRVNVAALAADPRQKSRLEAQGFTPSPSWEGHNAHFLWYAALMVGRGDQALEQARWLAERSAARNDAGGEFMRALPLVTLVRLERWADVLAAATPASESGFAAAIAHQSRGVALVRTGRMTEADVEAAALDAAIASTTLDGEKVYGVDSAREVLAVLRARLEAELAAARGAADAAARALAQAAEREDALEINEPPLLAAGSRLALGDAWLKAARPVEAERAYRADLAEHPDSGWAWRGIERSLAAQGKRAEATAASAELARAWTSADATLRSPRGF